MIVHESRNSAFRRPFGAAETGTEVYLAAEKAGAADMTLRLHPFTGEDTLLPMASEGGGRFSVTVTLPETPCVLWYSFRTGDDETCAWQITVYKKAAVPDWWKDGVVYQIFPDRFARERGWTPREPEARRGTHRFLVRDWDTPVFYPRAENGDVSSWPFWGGTLRGIEEKLPYLASLGITVLYLNPIFEAASNHRYDTADYTRVDPLLGRKKDFESLCEAARKRGIRIVLDGVFNHTGADSVYFDKFGNYGTAEKYRSWFRFGEQYRHGYECWWDVPDLPNVEENDPSFREFLCGEDGVVRRWLRRGASGWRLDVADELPDSLIRDIRAAIDSVNRNIAADVGVEYNTAREKTNQSPAESMRQHMASCTGLSVLLVDALRAAGIPARFAGTPAWHDDRGNHSWVEVWIDGRWHFTEYYFPGRLDYAWFFADAGQASPDDRAHGIFAVSFRPAGDWFPMVWSEDSREVHGVNVTQRYRDLYASYEQALVAQGRHTTVTFVMYDSAAHEGRSDARVAANVDVFCGAEQMGGGRTAGPRQDMNDALRFLLEKGKSYTFRYENARGETTEVTAEVGDAPLTVTGYMR